uniref:Small ribosomal subunit protein mS38 n=1 Tax=Lynx canadensis TaxID=61383 RepID=A0A667GIE5_LYNCA
RHRIGNRLQALSHQVHTSLCSRPWPISGVIGRGASQPCYSTQTTGPSGLDSLPGKGLQLELGEVLVPRKMSISPLESWLSIHLLPRVAAGGPGTVAPAQLYECPPSQVGEQAEQGCKNVLKIRRRKMNHHKYCKLVKMARFLRRISEYFVHHSKNATILKPAWDSLCLPLPGSVSLSLTLSQNK